MQVVEDDIGPFGGRGNEVPYPVGVFCNDGIGKPVLPILDLLIDKPMQLILERLPNLVLLRWLVLPVFYVGIFIRLLVCIKLLQQSGLYLFLQEVSKVGRLD